MLSTPAPRRWSSSVASTRQPASNIRPHVRLQVTPGKQFASRAAHWCKASLLSAVQAKGAPMGDETEAKLEETDPLQNILALQTFEGYWTMDAQLLEVVGLSARHKPPPDVESKVWATVLAITFSEGRMADGKEAWVMVIERAWGWLEGMEKGKDRHLEEKWTWLSS